MDREPEHSDRAARGRRIFDALRRNRAEGEADDADDAGTGDDPPATTTAVEDRPAEPSADEQPTVVDEPSAEANGEAPAPEPGPAPAPPAEAAEAGEAGDQAPPPAPEALPPSVPDDAGGGGDEPARDEPAGDEDETGDGLPGVDVLRAQLGPPPTLREEPEAPEAPEAPTVVADTVGERDAAEPAERAEPAPSPIPEPAPPPSPAMPEPPPSDALPRVVAIANQKGGVGKTTTAVNLGASLSELGYRVLIVDLDPQGNATTGLGIDIRNLDGSVYDSVMGDDPLEDCIEATSVRNLFVAPSNMDLAGAEIELVPVFSRELKLRRAIEAVKSEYDFVLIDCPPSLGLLTVNGLAAADDVVVPIQCEYYALEGLGQLVNNVNLVRSNLNPVLDIRGIVLTMYDARTKLADQVVNEVRTHFGDRCYETVVPRTVRLSEAPSFGQPIIVFDNSSRGSDAYRALAQEVAERVAGRPRDPVNEENDRDD